MKNTGTISLKNTLIAVNEITISQMLSLKDKFANGTIQDSILGLIPYLVDVEPKFLLELTPSELETLYLKIKEVNASFLKYLPLDKMLSGYKEKIVDIMTQTVTSSLSVLSTGLYQQGMDQQLTNTDTAGL